MKSQYPYRKLLTVKFKCRFKIVCVTETEGKILICFSTNPAPAQLLPVPSSLSISRDTLGNLCASEALYILVVSVYSQGVKMI
jgi:hypothetical protein